MVLFCYLLSFDCPFAAYRRFIGIGYIHCRAYSAVETDTETIYAHREYIYG